MLFLFLYPISLEMRDFSGRKKHFRQDRFWKVWWVQIFQNLTRYKVLLAPPLGASPERYCGVATLAKELGHCRRVTPCISALAEL